MVLTDTPKQAGALNLAAKCEKMLKDQMQFNPLYKLYYYSKSQMYDIDALQKAMKRIENLFIYYHKIKKAHFD